MRVAHRQRDIHRCRQKCARLIEAYFLFFSLNFKMRLQTRLLLALSSCTIQMGKAVSNGRHLLHQTTPHSLEPAKGVKYICTDFSCFSGHTFECNPSGNFGCSGWKDGHRMRYVCVSLTTVSAFQSLFFSNVYCTTNRRPTPPHHCTVAWRRVPTAPLVNVAICIGSNVRCTRRCTRSGLAWQS